MSLDPDNNPREFLTVLLAAGLYVFQFEAMSKGGNSAILTSIELAERFIVEIEKKVGKLNP